MSATWTEKNGAHFGFFGPICFRGNFEEIGRPLAKVLLGANRLSHVVWVNFVDVGCVTSEKVCYEVALGAIAKGN